MRKTRRNRYLLFVLVMLLIAGGAVFVLLSPIFRISSIKIAGTNRLSEREVRESLPFTEGDHILLIKSELARQIITSDKRVSWTEIHRRLPDEVDVLIREENPELLLSAGKIWGLTHTGKLLPIDYPYEIPNLPILSGVGEEIVLEPYKQSNSESLLKGLEFWQTVKEISPEFLDKVSEIHVANNGDIQVILTGDGMVVEFGGSKFDKRVLRLTAILKDIGAARSDINTIDLRYSDQAVVCWESEEDEQSELLSLQEEHSTTVETRPAMHLPNEIVTLSND